MGWIARSQLASAVSNAGALGIIETSSGELDNVRDEIRRMRDLTDRPFGVNIAQAFVRDPSIAEFVIEQGVRFVTTSAGDPTKYTSTLKAAGLTVFVIASRHVKALRTRYGTAGNKDDRADAYLLADVLRTDGHRLRPLQPDSPETVTLRATVRARKDLVQTRIRLMQQLRAHLELVYPGAVGLFWDLDSPIALRFLLRYPSAAKAAWLSPKRMAAWLRGEGYCGRTSPDELCRRLEAAPRRGTRPEAEARVAHSLAFVRALLAVRDQVAELEARIAEQLELHPDGMIFRSLPRAGQVRAAGLLSEIGDVRERFPTPE
jgi:transposase